MTNQPTLLLLPLPPPSCLSLMESPFSQYLNTNYAPGDSEVHLIRTHLSSHIQELARLDMLIRDLTSQRDLLNAYIDDHKALISPARRIPPDIVQEIFLACLPTGHNAVMASTEAPLLLCQICSAWRIVALSTPLLWASLHVYVDFVLADRQRISYVAEWLARSAHCALSLSLAAQGCELSHNCLTQLEAADAAALQTIELRAHGTGPASPHRNRPRFAPYLFHVRLPLAWDPLTHLALVNGNETGWVDDINDILAILPKCPRLVSIDGQAWTVNHNGSTHFSTVPKFHDFMELVSMPELRRLQLPKTGLAATLRDTEFLLPLAAGSPKLERLTLDLGSLAVEPFYTALRALPCLTTLHITDLNFGDYWDRPNPEFPYIEAEALLRFLASADSDNNNNNNICPALRDLELTNAQVSEAAVLQFGGNRRQVRGRGISPEKAARTFPRERDGSGVAGSEPGVAGAACKGQGSGCPPDAVVGTGSEGLTIRR
ncbi:hypothetical protein C8R43DRAFT_1115080 [Mycena crocata]|nr:hypothetical protein C8R43DRAFT_1115080 [Mycena crocata]